MALAGCSSNGDEAEPRRVRRISTTPTTPTTRPVRDPALVDPAGEFCSTAREFVALPPIPADDPVAARQEAEHQAALIRRLVLLAPPDMAEAAAGTLALTEKVLLQLEQHGWRRTETPIGKNGPDPADAAHYESFLLALDDACGVGEIQR